MNLAGLMEAFRDEASDTEQPYLWSDSEVWRYVDQAVTRFVSVTGGIRDAASPVTDLILPAGAATVELDPCILKLLNVMDPLRGRLNLINHTDPMAALVASTGLVARYIVRGETEGMIRPVPVPTADQAVKLTVTRLPLKSIVDENSKLEVRPEYVPHLVYGVLARAFLKDDPETYQPARAEKNMTRFEELCEAAKSELQMRNRAPQPIQYGGL